MNTKTLDRLPAIAAVALIFLIIAACTIHLRGDEDQITSSSSADQAADPLAAKIAECRSVTSEQRDALAECRKAWVEKRRQFLGQKAPPSSFDNGPPQEVPSLFVRPKDQSRLSPGYPPIQQSGKE